MRNTECGLYMKRGLLYFLIPHPLGVGTPLIPPFGESVRERGIKLAFFFFIPCSLMAG